MNNDIAIALKNISHTFDGGEPLFSKVNFALRRKEKLVLMGPSGQGKSTLLKIISGLINPTRGEVFVDGLDLYHSDRSTQKRLKNKIGMLFQKNALFDSLTIGENLGFPLRESTRLSTAEIKEKVESDLEAVGLGGKAHLFPDEISGGMKKRVGIARALVLSPEIILYDDPTAGLDPITSRIIMDLIIHLHSKFSSTLVMITNDMHRAFQVADRLAFVMDGELILTGNVEETKNFKEPRIQKFILGEYVEDFVEGAS